LTEVRGEDKAQLELFQKNFRASYTDNTELRRKWGGGKVGIKSQHQIDARQAALEKETLKKQGL